MDCGWKKGALIWGWRLRAMVIRTMGIFSV